MTIVTVLNLCNCNYFWSKSRGAHITYIGYNRAQRAFNDDGQGALRPLFEASCWYFFRCCWELLPETLHMIRSRTDSTICAQSGPHCIIRGEVRPSIPTVGEPYTFCTFLGRKWVHYVKHPPFSAMFFSMIVLSR